MPLRRFQPPRLLVRRSAYSPAPSLGLAFCGAPSSSSGRSERGDASDDAATRRALPHHYSAQSRRQPSLAEHTSLMGTSKPRAKEPLYLLQMFAYLLTVYRAYHLSTSSPSPSLTLSLLPFLFLPTLNNSLSPHLPSRLPPQPPSPSFQSSAH